MRWIYQSQIDKDHELMKYGRVLAQILYSRGIQTEKESEAYLHPELSELPEPELIPNVGEAVTKIVRAMDSGKKIVIYGDYDVDGISSTALLFDYLYRVLKADVKPYIPNRFDEGYGLNELALRGIVESGVGLIITVDCGIRDAKLVNKFAKDGLEIIVTDHHALPEGKLKFAKSVTVVHPRLTGSKYPKTDICATTIAWKLVKNLNKVIKQDFDTNKYLDLVAMATVCDVMPLVGENRVIVKYGLEKLKETENIGLRAILVANKLTPDKLDAYHFGFVLGPRLNAAGRMEDALFGLRLLTTRDEKAVPILIRKLELLNKERQALTGKYLTEAELQVAKQIKEGNRLLSIVGEKWSEGIIGLVAGKITEKYHLPSFVATKLEGSIKGSARSIGGFNIIDAISQSADLLDRFGGHSQAAGFTLQEANFNQFRDQLNSVAKENVNDEISEKVLEIDSELSVDELTLDFTKELNNYRPFGYGNRAPVFSLTNTEVVKASTMGKEGQHFRLTLLVDGQKHIGAVAFNRLDLFAYVGFESRVDVAFNLDVNTWNGEDNVQLNIKDIKPHKT